jgi:hypothetical protein
MRRMLERSLLGLLFVGVACSSAPTKSVASSSESCAAPPSYQADVAPILKEHCASCHAGDGSAAADHDFSSELRVYAARKSIARQVSAHAMPPRPHPAPSEGQLQILLRFADCAPAPHN